MTHLIGQELQELTQQRVERLRQKLPGASEETEMAISDRSNECEVAQIKPLI